MSKIIIDKNFQSGNSVKTAKVVFTPTIKQSSISKRVSISHSFRSTKPVTKK